MLIIDAFRSVLTPLEGEQFEEQTEEPAVEEKEVDGPFDDGTQPIEGPVAGLQGLHHDPGGDLLP